MAEGSRPVDTFLEHVKKNMHILHSCFRATLFLIKPYAFLTCCQSSELSQVNEHSQREFQAAWLAQCLLFLVTAFLCKFD